MEAARLVCSSKNGRKGLKTAAFESAGDYVNPNPNDDIIHSPNISNSLISLTLALTTTR